MVDDSTPSSVLIVGGSLAGVRCAGQLRRSGFDGSLTIVDAEPHRPYDRPPLSKQFLAGEWDDERIGLLADDKYDDLQATWMHGTLAVSLDVVTRTVTLDDGRAASADAVVLATGASPRRLPGTDGIEGVHVLRTLDDAAALRSDLDGGAKRLVVIGAGFIGAEVAATASKLGHSVTIVEAAEVPMERGLGREMGLFCGGLHADHGVELLRSTGVDRVRSADERVVGVTLSNGDELDADIVVVGIGVEPNTSWLESSGLELDNGVVCDARCQAADGIFAAGDVARWHNERFDELMRVEHWENAIEQGIHVAKQIMGESEPFTPVPWFWSDQYDHKIHLAGRPQPGDTIEIVTGSRDELRFAAIYGRDDVLTGVFGLNRPRHVMQYRRLIVEGASWSDALEFAEAARAKEAAKS